MQAALRGLDPYSFWIVPASELTGGDPVVVGTTGAFVVKPCGSPGVVNFGVTGADVSGRAVVVRGLRRSTKGLQASLTASSVAASVEPIVCFTAATLGEPTTVRGVRFLSVRDLVKEIAGRPAAVERARAQRAARALGMNIAGDERRHFAAG